MLMWTGKGKTVNTNYSWS